MNEFFELIEDVEEREAGSFIWICPICHALFGSKAIYGRTIFVQSVGVGRCW